MVDFWVEWCGFCCLFGLVIEKVVEVCDGQVEFVKFDIDVN